MTIQEIADYTAHAKAADKATVLGSICFFTVVQTSVPYSDAAAKLNAVGLGAALPKNPPADIDVFRRVFSNGQRRSRMIGPDERENLLIREVSKAPDRLVKRIVIETVDAAGEVLNYSEAVEVVWNAANPGALDIRELNIAPSLDFNVYLPDDEATDAVEPAVVEAPKPVNPMLAELLAIRALTAPEADDEEATPEPVAEALEAAQPVQTVAAASSTYTTSAVALATELKAQYLAERGHLDGLAVRGIIGRSLDACKAVLVKESGGVYFVSTDYDAELGALEQLASAMPGVSFHTLPLVDDRKQRDMLRAAFTAEVTTDVQRTITECIEAVQSGEDISPRKFKALQARYVEAKAKAAEYTQLLEDQTDQTNFGLTILGAHIGTLLGKVAQ